MDHAEQKQISLGLTQPPFPDGWVLAVFEAIRKLSPGLDRRHGLSRLCRTGTAGRTQQGKALNQNIHDDWEAKLARIVTEIFPQVSAINGFAKAYVGEFFRLWFGSAEFAPAWVKFLGITPAASEVLAKALIRDLLLRLCYLESCEHRLSGRKPGSWPEPRAPAAHYHALLATRKKTQNVTAVRLAKGLKVSAKRLQRWQTGQAVPSWSQLRRLVSNEEEARYYAGVVFLDNLLRRLGLREGLLAGELLEVASIFHRTHPSALENFRGEVPTSVTNEAPAFRQCGFEEYVRYGQHLLLHPGFESLRDAIPDPLWRTHVRVLQFARMSDLARAYLQIGEVQTEEALVKFLEQAEQEGGPDQWMQNLNRSAEIHPFPAK